MEGALTHTEEQLMLKLWYLHKASVKDILVLYPDPKPAFNTISTIIRILERKEVVKHEKLGRGYVYLPRLSKENYRKMILNHLLINFYDGDYQQFNSEANLLKRLDSLL